MAGPTELLVLHALRLRSLCPVEVVAARFDLDVVDVDRVLAAASSAGRVRYREGRLSGWSLTGDGRRYAEGLLAAELEAAGARAGVEDGYLAFLSLNPQVLAVCTDWQVRPGPEGPVVNDHADPERDAEVLDRLRRLHAEVVPVTDRLGAALGRLGGYGDRLGAALDRVLAGDTGWLTRPTIDSYHTVWFELHEDLLATLGRSRTDEPRRAADPGVVPGGVTEEYA